MSMTVILTDHVEHLGERGDVVRVKPGYARNYLLPQGLAYSETVANRRRFDEEQSSWQEMDLARKSAAEKLAAEIAGTELVFERRAGETDVLFGSVSMVDLAKGLADHGVDIDRRRILLAEPIKNLGTSTVDVKVYQDMVVPITVHVVRPGEKPGQAVEAVEPEAVAEPAE